MANENKPIDQTVLSDFLHEFLKKRFKKQTLVDNMMVSIVYSAFRYKDKYVDCEMFFKFVTSFYLPLELSYFIFVR